MYGQDGQPSAASEFNENTWHPSCFCLWMLCEIELMQVREVHSTLQIAIIDQFYLAIFCAWSS